MTAKPFASRLALLAGMGLSAFLSGAPAQAQESEEEPIEESTGGGLLDIDIGEIDLGGDTKGGEQSMTYDGQVGQDAANYKAGTPVTITHTKGTVSVRCTDTDGITARINFSIDGTRNDAMKRLGDSIALRTYASNTEGKISSNVPPLASGVEAVRAPLVVTLPRSAKVNVTGGDGWIQVVGCTGTVKASTRKGGIYVDGVLSSFDLSAGDGDIEAELDASAVLTGASRATATLGAVTLRMPLTQKGTLNARGAEVSVEHLVSGTNTATLVQGALADKGPAISLTAKKKVTVTAPK